MRKALAVAAVLFAGWAVSTADAAQYQVRKGDTLSGIAQRELGSAKRWPEIAAANKIRDPRNLRAGAMITIPETAPKVSAKSADRPKVPAKSLVENPKSAEGRYFEYRNPGAEKYTGYFETALDLLGYPEVVKEKFSKSVSVTPLEEVQHTVLNHGDVVKAMVFGRDKVRQNVRANWNDPRRALAARRYVVVHDNVEYGLLYILWCGNWTREFDRAVPVLPPAKPVVLPSPPPAIIPPPPPQPPPSPPMVTMPEPEAAVAFPPPDFGPRDLGDCNEHELILGAGAFLNRIAKGAYGYGEYMRWWRECHSQYSLGAGILVGGDIGWSRVSEFDWWGYQIAPEVGVKRYWLSENDFYRQWQIKGRVGYERRDNGRAERYIKLGLYGEYDHQLSDTWAAILTAETWWAVWKQNSDQESRTFLGVNTLLERKLNEKWAVRFGPGAAWQDWDETLWATGLLELRYKMDNGVLLAFGPGIKAPINMSDSYQGLTRMDLLTVSALVRAEFGEYFRIRAERKRVERVWSVSGSENTQEKTAPAPVDVAGTPWRTSAGEVAAVNADTPWRK